MLGGSAGLMAVVETPSKAIVVDSLPLLAASGAFPTGMIETGAMIRSLDNPTAPGVKHLAMPEDAAWNLRLLPASHPGLSEAKALGLCAAACVCLHRHHRSPTTIEMKIDAAPTSEHSVTWAVPTVRDRNANRNAIEATCDGAYAVALMCLERRLDLVAVGRAEQGSGADWYVAPPGCGIDETGEPNLDDPAILRLEVGGHDHRPSLPYELKLKVRQLQVGASTVPGIAAIIGFEKGRVLIQTNVLAGEPASLV